MRWSAFVLDTLVAPKLSSLNLCGAPDVPELPHYLGSLRLNQLFGPAKYEAAHSVMLSNFISRLGIAISEYRIGREHLLKYVATLPEHDHLSEHRKAVAHFETCIIQAHIAMLCLNGLGKLLPGIPPMFKNGDGSDYDRLRLLNNRVKHFDEDVESLTQTGSESILMAPVWITNEGLEASTASLQFSELADILITHSTDAKGFSEDIFQELAAIHARKADDIIE